MNHWSARQLAENTDGVLTRDTIANIENNRRTDITVRQFLAIALALRVPPAALLVDLERPLEPSSIGFPGIAPAPLEPTAPQIAVAGWMNGGASDDTTPAARWVARVTALLAEYLAAADIYEAQGALQRISAAPQRGEESQFAVAQNAARTELLTLGVHVASSG